MNMGKMSKEEFIVYQQSLANDEIRPFMRCGCLVKLKIDEAYKCLYCGQWFCQLCAEVHFGKTIKQHQEERVK